MPAQTNLAPDDRMKEWLSSQIDTLQDFLNRLASPVFAVADPLPMASFLSQSVHIHLPHLQLLLWTLCLSLIRIDPFLDRWALFLSSACFLVLSLIRTFYRAYVPHVGFSQPIWLQYGYETRVPYAIMDLTSIAPEITIDQAYDVHLHLTVPTNDRNMNSVTSWFILPLLRPHHIIPPYIKAHATCGGCTSPDLLVCSMPSSILRTLFFLSSPPSVQHVRVPLLEHRIIHPSSLGKRTKIAYARIDVGRQDIYSSPTLLLERNGWGELQIYKAVLVFDAHLEGLRWALYYHPYISFCFFSAFFFTAELMAVLLTWGAVLYRESPNKSVKSGVIPTEESSSERPQKLRKSASTKA
ncbi:hypothetical protein Pst134EB_010335 [Puccinia striiformis f. sp. tritici]|nr:hypothetical protein Pst134EB_010335 [Puccinia striiformis f. sp. tritici]